MFYWITADIDDFLENSNQDLGISTVFFFGICIDNDTIAGAVLKDFVSLNKFCFYGVELALHLLSHNV